MKEALPQGRMCGGQPFQRLADGAGLHTDRVLAACIRAKGVGMKIWMAMRTPGCGDDRVGVEVAAASASASRR